MTEYRTGNHFQAKPNNDSVCFFHLKDRKKQSKAAAFNNHLRKFVSFFSAGHGTSSVKQTMNEQTNQVIVTSFQLYT